MALAPSLNWRDILVRGIVAGIIGGVLLHAFIYVVTLAPQHRPLTELWQFIASAAIGKSAFSNPNSAWLGLLLHVCVSMGWGVAFSYVAYTRPGVPAHPYISGVVFGVVVMIIMQIVTMVAGVFAVPTVPSFLTELVAHAVFFGLAVSLYVTRTMRT